MLGKIYFLIEMLGLGDGLGMFNPDALVGRKLPAIKSNRNKRHSIGPFHMGMRRLALSRIWLGKSMSGVSSQQVQPV